MRKSDPELSTIDEDAAWDLIPWYVNGTLDDAERRAVEAHMAANPSFRTEVAEQTRLAKTVASLDSMDVEMERSLSAIRQQIQAEAPQTRSPEINSIGSAVRRLAKLLRWDAKILIPLGAVAASIVLLVVALPFTTSQDPSYTTLTSPTTVTDVPQLRVKVSGDATEIELRRLFMTHELQVIDGPSATGVYTLETSPGGDADEIAAALLQSPQIEFAAVRRSP